MTVGDIVRTMQPTPVVIWRKGSATPTNGQPVGFDASGDIIIAINTTDGPLAMKTTLNKTVSGVIYYCILIFGVGVMVGGAAIVPNKFVSVNASSKIIASVTTVTTPTAGEVSALWRNIGFYIGLESDFATNDFTLSNAADTNLILVFVGRNP